MHTTLPALSRLVSALALAAAAGAVPAQTADIYYRDASGTWSNLSASGGAPVTLAPTAIDHQLYGGYQLSRHAGTAAPLQQTLRAVAMLSSAHPTQPNLFTANSEASFRKTVLVDPGSSGLPPGAPITLNVLLQLDGNSGAGLFDPTEIPSPGGGLANARMLSSAEILASYRVRDLDQPVCGEGCQPLTLLNFGYSADLLYDSKYDMEVDTRWSPVGTLVGGVQSPNPRYFYSTDVSVSGSVSDFMHTGQLLFTVDTFIGHQLEVTASIDIFLQAMGQGTIAQAAGRFGNSFDADLTSPVAGVLLAGEVAGIYPAVPEPGTWALWLAGIAGLRVRLRRRA